jgi:hypothetical protein
VGYGECFVQSFEGGSPGSTVAAAADALVHIEGGGGWNYRYDSTCCSRTTISAGNGNVISTRCGKGIDSLIGRTAATP